MECHETLEFGKVVGGHAMEAGVDSGAEVGEGLVVVVCEAFFGELPEALDQVEIEAVGWQLEQLDGRGSATGAAARSSAGSS